MINYFSLLIFSVEVFSVLGFSWRSSNLQDKIADSYSSTNRKDLNLKLKKLNRFWLYWMFVANTILISMHWLIFKFDGIIGGPLDNTFTNNMIKLPYFAMVIIIPLLILSIFMGSIKKLIKK